MVVDEGEEAGEREKINVDGDKQLSKPELQAAAGAEPQLRSSFPETWLFVDSSVG
jgi:hypothetical protein